MGFSTYLANEILDHVILGSTYTAPTGIFVSLHSADPGNTGANELTGNGYARITARADFGTVAASKTIDNDTAITFAAASGGDWSAATHFGLWDAVSGGNFLFGAALTASKTVQDGDDAEFAAGELDVTLA